LATAPKFGDTAIQRYDQTYQTHFEWRFQTHFQTPMAQDKQWDSVGTEGKGLGFAREPRSKLPAIDFSIRWSRKDGARISRKDE